jgi:hypothetical protein
VVKFRLILKNAVLVLGFFLKYHLSIRSDRSQKRPKNELFATTFWFLFGYRYFGKKHENPKRSLFEVSDHRGRVLGGGGFHLKEIVGITGGLDFTLE